MNTSQGEFRDFRMYAAAATHLWGNGLLSSTRPTAGLGNGTVFVGSEDPSAVADAERWGRASGWKVGGNTNPVRPLSGPCLARRRPRSGPRSDPLSAPHLPYLRPLSPACGRCCTKIPSTAPKLTLTNPTLP